ncbi:MAG: ANTAR domain-containing protein [Actinomycetes bacterium]
MIEHRELTESDAFREIQRAAMDQRTTMRAVAEELISQYGS